jgi:hypothetical protein
MRVTLLQPACRPARSAQLAASRARARRAQQPARAAAFTSEGSNVTTDAYIAVVRGRPRAPRAPGRAQPRPSR